MKLLLSTLVVCLTVIVCAAPSAFAEDVKPFVVKKDQKYTEEIIQILCARSNLPKWREGCIKDATEKMKKGEPLSRFDRRMLRHMHAKMAKAKAETGAKKAVQPASPTPAKPAPAKP